MTALRKMYLAGLFAISWQPASAVFAAEGPSPATSFLPAFSGTLRIMPLGDSITDGAGGTNAGYRGPLNTLLNNAGITHQFVGSATNNVGSLPADQQHHEGHSGFTITGGGRSGILDNINTWLGATGADPDFILLMIGTNDVTTYATTLDTVPQATSNLNTLISTISSKTTGLKPNAQLIIAEITPIITSSQDAIAQAYNQSVVSLVAQHHALGENVSLVDMHSALNISTDMNDNLHPNDTGYNKMAQVWLAGIISAAHNLTWDITNTAGSWNTTAGNQPWKLNDGTAGAYQEGNPVNFTQAGNATITVDAVGVTPFATTISHPSGSYTFSGGAIGGPLTKSGAGTAVLQSVNNFSNVAINGGTVQTQVNGALGSGGITLGGGAWQTTTTDQTSANIITVSATSTIQTDTRLTLTNTSGINGAGQSLVKTGAGVLELKTANPNLGDGSGTTSLTINNGTVLLSPSGGTFYDYAAGKGSLIVNSGGTIAGIAHINPFGSLNKVIINSGGTIAPGAIGAGNTGTLYITSDLVLAGTYAVDLTAAGNDLLQVASDSGGAAGINLTGSKLNINLGFAPAIGSTFKILQNDTTGASYTGLLGGYKQGATVVLGPNGGFVYQAAISYTGGDGNDIVLQNVVAVTNTLTWNTATYPTGQWNTQSANQPWLNGAVPATFVTTNKAVFSQDGGAAITVGSEGVSSDLLTISNASGTYTFSGGSINSNLAKSGTGNTVFNTSVNFPTASILDGTTTFAGTTNTIGSLTVDIGALALTGGTTTLGTSTLGGNGRLDVSAALNVSSQYMLISRGTLNFNAGATGTISRLDVTSGVTDFASGAAGTVTTINLSGAGSVVTFEAGATTNVPTLNVKSGTATINSLRDSAGTQGVGTVAVSGSGRVNLGGSAGTLAVSGGIVTITAPAVQVATADFSTPGSGAVNGTATNPLTITSTLKLPGGNIAAISSGSSFTASSGGNLASNTVARTLTLSGGKMTWTAAPTINLPNTNIAVAPGSTSTLDFSAPSNDHTLGNLSIAASAAGTGLTLQNANSFTAAGGITVTNSGTAGINGGVPITLPAGQNVSVADGAKLTIAAPIGGASVVNKTGIGPLELTSANSYTGGTTISAGTLLVNNTTGSATGTGAVLIGTSGTLGGIGAINGPLTINGALAPGNSPGTLYVNNDVTFNATAVCLMQISGSASGEYDQLRVTGNVSLGGTLLPSFDNFIPTGNEILFLIDNTGGGTTTGQFQYADGADIGLYNGYDWHITYTANNAVSPSLNGGNDVAIYVVPEPSILMLLGVAAIGRLSRRRRR